MIMLNREGTEPLYEQVFAGLKEQIITGKWKEGERLPATRTLAAELAVSRNTIDQAYGQLCAEGYITGRRGSGYYINRLEDVLPDGRTLPLSENSRTKTAWLQESLSDILPYSWQKHCRYNLEYGSIHTDDFPHSLWKKMLNRALLDAPDTIHTAYGNRDGIKELREELARYLIRSRGLNCTPEQIITGSSTQQLLQMASAMLQTACGVSCFAVENPGFQTVRRVLELQNSHVLPIPVEDDGISVDSLRKTSARAIYITPSHQFPSGAVMPVRKRLQLLQWAQETDSFILEDDYDSELRYGSMPIPALQGLCNNDTVLYFGTTSKAFAPTVRIAYMVLPNRLLSVYDALYADFKCTVPELYQYAFALFMKEGHWERHLRRVLTRNRRKHDLLVKLLEQHLGSDFDIKGKGGGLHLILEAKGDISEQELLQQAFDADVGVYPVSCYYTVPPSGRAQIMLGFASLEAGQITDAVTRLQHAFLTNCQRL